MSDILLHHEEMEEIDTEPCKEFETFTKRPDPVENPLEWELMYSPLKVGERAYDEIKEFIMKTQEKYSKAVSLFDVQCILDCINEEIAGLDHAKRKKQREK